MNKKRNYANSDVNIFDPTTDSLTRQAQHMAFKRWYATIVTLPGGEHIVPGGRIDRYFAGNATAPRTEAAYASTPEVRNIAGKWRKLTAVDSNAAFGSSGVSWYYPRAWVNPQGSVYILGHNGLMHNLDSSGTSKLSKHQTRAPASRYSLGSFMFASGRIFSIRKNRVAVVININGNDEPVMSSTASLTKERQYSTVTVLADDEVWVNGELIKRQQSGGHGA